MSEKVTGYILLGVGVFLILLSLFNAYQVFSGRAKAVALFRFSGISLDLTGALAASLPAGMAQTGKNAAEPVEMIPAEMINQPANLFIHFLFLGFVINGGYRLSSLGTQLLRPIVVKGKEV